MKRHFLEIDLCRGWGILLVVLGHALKQTGETPEAFQVLLSVIYSFHMPLFFVLSGFVSGKLLSFRNWKERGTYIRERAFRLLIPYFTVGVLYMPLKLMLSRYALKPYDLSSVWRIFLGENPDVALWFIYILFWASALSALLITEKTRYFWLAAAFLCSLVSFGTGSSLRLLRYWFFFLLGLCLRASWEKAAGKLRAPGQIAAALAVFSAANVFLYPDGPEILEMVTALSGTAFSLGLSLWLAEKKTGKEGLRLLGVYSMDIYIFSEPLMTAAKLLFWDILHVPYVLCTLLCLMIGLALPIPISRFIVRKIKLFRVAFLGMR